jgi:predicted GIY-YIG superfamily endonuclease
LTKKEKQAAANKKSYEKNKEKRLAQMRVWQEANKERKDAIDKAFRESKKDGLFTVYLLVNENYVGQTTSLYTRLNSHKSNQGRDVSNVQIIGKYKTREEAKAVEAEYHSKGYLGYYNGR